MPLWINGLLEAGEPRARKMFDLLHLAPEEKFTLSVGESNCVDLLDDGTYI
jgi:hypothetical protein